MTEPYIDVNSQLFAALRQMIPDLPENTTKLWLRLQAGSVPVVQCEYHVCAKIGIETHELTFELRPINETHVVR